jgi:hypothetical protein
MVVHSMDSPGLEGSNLPLRTRRGRLWMVLVWIICAAPVVGSYLTFYVIRPESRSSFGDLIEPQRPVPDLAARSLDGNPVNLMSLKGQWLLISVAGGACNSACEQHLYLQRQLRESVGREKDRVDWVWLVTDDAIVPNALRPALSGATVLAVSQKALSRWLNADAGHQIDDHLYLVDPLGNWMMRFPAGLDLQSAAKAKRDLDRLLRASVSWDKAGR